MLIGLMALLVKGTGQVILTSSDLPIVLLDTYGQEIPDDEKIDIGMKLIYNGPGLINHVGDTSFNYSGLVGIEKRGSTSITFPKSSYSFETRDSCGGNLNVSLVDLPEENDWVLYGPFSDKTLMRNVIGYELYRKMGWYAPRSRLCEVMLNDDYVGVYVLTEKIKRDNNRVDIATLTSNDTTGDQVTGGYILQVDRHEGPGWTSTINNLIFFQQVYPKGDEIHPSQQAYIQQKIQSIEEFLAEAGDEDADSIANILNVDNFLDYMIISELTKNIDSYRLSTYIHKDKDSNDPRFMAGPVWDYNLAMGNCEYDDGWRVDNFLFDDSAKVYFNHHLFWFRKILDIEPFRDKWRDRWIELQGSVLMEDSIFALIDSVAGFIQEAQVRNFERWDIMGTYIWPNYYVGATYQEEVDILKNWIHERISWMDGQIAWYADHPAEESISGCFVYPQPFTDEFNLLFPDDPGLRTARVVLYDHRGNAILDRQVTPSTPGVLTVNTAGLQMPGGMYHVRCILDGKKVITGKVVKY